MPQRDFGLRTDLLALRLKCFRDRDQLIKLRGDHVERRSSRIGRLIQHGEIRFDLDAQHVDSAGVRGGVFLNHTYPPNV